MSELQPDRGALPASGGAPTGIVTLVAVALLFSFGVTMLVFSAAYARDVLTLLRAPEMIWAFICGQPDPGGPVLPLMLTLGTLALLVGVVVAVWARLRRRRV